MLFYFFQNVSLLTTNSVKSNKDMVAHILQKKTLSCFLVLVSYSTLAHATSVNTGILANTTTSGTVLSGNLNSTPTSVIRFDVGGAGFVTAVGQLSVTVTVEATTPAVITGTAANQVFRDDTVGAAFFGYYLSTGVRTSNQLSATVTNIKIKVGTGATANRSYYLLGNGVTTPTAQTNLTAAPAVATTFVSTTSNTGHCGPNYSANGLTNATLSCATGSNVANMDLTQFVKILFTDPAGTAVISKIELTAAAE